MEQIILSIVIACIGSSALSSFAIHLIDRRDRKAERSDDTERQIEELTKRLDRLEKDTSFSRKSNHLQLKSSVKRISAAAVARGNVSIDDKAFVLESVELLHTDGENGEMTACADAVKALPIANDVA